LRIVTARLPVWREGDCAFSRTETVMRKGKGLWSEVIVVGGFGKRWFEAVWWAGKGRG